MRPWAMILKKSFKVVFLKIFVKKSGKLHYPNFFSLLMRFWSFCLLKMIITVPGHRSNHQRCSVRKGVLRNFTKFIGKHLCQSLFFNKVAGLHLFYRTPLEDCFSCYRKVFHSRGIFRTSSNISDGAFWEKKNKWLKAVSYVRKKPSSYTYLTGSKYASLKATLSLHWLNWLKDIDLEC